MKSNNRLPLSPKNNFGRLNIEKLKHKKVHKGINIIIKNNLISLSGTRKYKMAIMVIEVKPNTPSSPSK